MWGGCRADEDESTHDKGDLALHEVGTKHRSSLLSHSVQQRVQRGGVRSERATFFGCRVLPQADCDGKNGKRSRRTGNGVRTSLKCDAVNYADV